MFPQQQLKNIINSYSNKPPTGVSKNGGSRYSHKRHHTPLSLQKVIGTPNTPVNDENTLDLSKISSNTYSAVEVNEGELIKVALRIRPLNQLETQRGDDICCEVYNETICQLNNKGISKHYQFTNVLPPRTTQSEVFEKCGVTVVPYHS